MYGLCRLCRLCMMFADVCLCHFCNIEAMLLCLVCGVFVFEMYAVSFPEHNMVQFVRRIGWRRKSRDRKQSHHAGAVVIFTLPVHNFSMSGPDRRSILNISKLGNFILSLKLVWSGNAHGERARDCWCANGGKPVDTQEATASSIGLGVSKESDVCYFQYFNDFNDFNAQSICFQACWHPMSTPMASSLHDPASGVKWHCRPK